MEYERTGMNAIEQMQKAVDVVNTSLHPTNKIAATIFGGTPAFSLSRTNYWPDSILKAFGTNTDIGSSSGTLHAEVACILSAPVTEGASICVTDPFCPNCAKNMAEAGIKTIYIDHKGFDKDFASRRGSHFQNMSMQVCERAGISVYEVRRKEDRLVPILEIDPSYTPPNDAPVIVSILDHASEAIFLDMIADARANLQEHKFALALGRNSNDEVVALCARSHLAIGYSKRIDASELHEDSGKYSFILEPVNRVLMNAARLGLTLNPEYLYSSTVPTSRELVNVVGAGFTAMHIGNTHLARDDDALRAIKQLSDSKILKIQQ
jgi:dCMP deaminase